MTIDVKSSHKTPVGGNVFADLGFAPQQAEALQRQSKRIISEKLAIKESLMTELSLWIDQNNLKQVQAAQILGVTRPRVSDVIHKKNSEVHHRRLGRYAGQNRQAGSCVCSKHLSAN